MVYGVRKILNHEVLQLAAKIPFIGEWFCKLIDGHYIVELL